MASLGLRFLILYLFCIPGSSSCQLGLHVKVKVNLCNKSKEHFYIEHFLKEWYLFRLILITVNLLNRKANTNQLR